MPFNNNNNIGS